MTEERGVIFVVDGHTYPLTIEEAWTLRSHLPPIDDPLDTTSVQLEKLVREADEIDPPSPRMRIFESEKPRLRLALDRWLHDVTAVNYPERAWALRDALWIEDLGALAFRDVILVFEDGREEHHTNVLVTGHHFEHDGRIWGTNCWRRLLGIDEIEGELRTWLVCRELGPSGSGKPSI